MKKALWKVYMGVVPTSQTILLPWSKGETNEDDDVIVFRSGNEEGGRVSEFKITPARADTTIPAKVKWRYFGSFESHRVSSSQLRL